MWVWQVNFNDYCDGEKHSFFLRLYTLEKRVGLLWWVSVFMVLFSVKVKVNGYLHPHTHIYRGVMMWLFFLSNWGYGKGFEGGINNNHVYRLAHSILFLIVIWFCLLFVRCHFVELLLLFFFECVCVTCAAVAIFIVLAAIKVSIFFVPLNRMVLWSLGIDAKKGKALHRQANLTACYKSVWKLFRVWIACYLWE